MAQTQPFFAAVSFERARYVQKYV